MTDRLFVKVTRRILPRVKDKYPFLYLERGRFEVDDSSVKWIDCDKNVIRIPIATISCLLLGPGTAITHEAIKVISSSNCYICWVSEDGLHFHARGDSPTSDTRNMRNQLLLAGSKKKSLEVARNMFKLRYPTASLSNKSLKEMMGMEGLRVRDLYKEKSIHYGVEWRGRSYKTDDFRSSCPINQMITVANSYLYGLVSSVVHSLGFSPHIGFIHSGSPLPFVYDLADLYKEELSIDLAFSLASHFYSYDKQRFLSSFRSRVLSTSLLENLSKDIPKVLGV